MTDRIRERRAALAAQVSQAQQQYTELEQMLHMLDRQICAMQGGLQELDDLLADPVEFVPFMSPYVTGLDPAHEAALLETPCDSPPS